MEPVPQVLKVTLDWTIDADTMGQTIHHYKYTGGPPSAADCNLMAANFVSNASSAFQTLCATTIGVHAATVTDLTSGSHAQGAGGTPWVGTSGTGPLAPGSAVVCQHLIDRRYRGGKPRSYFPLGIHTDLASTGLWAAAFITNVDTQLGIWISGALASGVGCTIANLVNVSYYGPPNIVITNPVTHRVRNASTPRVPPIVDVIRGSIAKLPVGSQRRRNRDA
jgi:hypothetical protein